MRIRSGALAATWLLASLAAGIGSSAQGYVEGVWRDGTFVGTLDATLGWLVGTLPVSALALVFFFMPIATVLEFKNVRAPLPYVVGGALAGALLIALFVNPQVSGPSILILLVPGIVAGITWWWMAIGGDELSPESLQ